MKSFIAVLFALLLTACAIQNEPLPVATEGTEVAIDVSIDTASLDVPYASYFNETNPWVYIEFANYDPMVLELFPETAPITVAQITRLVDQGFYDGVIFHRIIQGFMIQGGDPTGTGTGGAGNQITGEFVNNDIVNRLRHWRGVISMARSSDPNSASSQFFIVHQDSDFLDGDYATFGGVIQGFETLDAIASVNTTFPDRPIEDVVMTRVRLIER
jgi:peptidyl-prolyl cis-trans isomerase B (cyclophilin B)